MKCSGLIFFCILYKVSSESDDKRWVWAAEGRNQKQYTGITSNSKYTSAALLPPSTSLFRPSSGVDESLSSQATKLRYEVSEPSSYPRPPQNRPGIYAEEQFRPTTTTINGYKEDPFKLSSDSYRPINNRPNQNGYRPDDDGYRPIYNERPTEDNYRPINNNYRPNENNYRPGSGPGYQPGNGGSYRPTTGPNGRPVLTGPVPSWQEGDTFRYKDYDRCKCVHSFNCNTPGIKFGTCDTDKQYCCYNEIGSDRPGRPGNFQDNTRDRPVLAGPGGPVDKTGVYKPYKGGYESSRPYRPNYDNTRYSDRFKDSSSSAGLEEAYRRGLESAIHETIQKPNRFSGRREYGGYQDYYSEDSFNRRPRPNQKYGLYEPAHSYYGGRSANSSIEAEIETKP